MFDVDCLFVVGDGLGVGEKVLKIVIKLCNLFGKYGVDFVVVLDVDLCLEG